MFGTSVSDPERILALAPVREVILLALSHPRVPIVCVRDTTSLKTILAAAPWPTDPDVGI